MQDRNTEATDTATATDRTTMVAIAHTRFGAPVDAIELTEVAMPEPAADEVLIAVKASGIAIGDWLTVTGTPYVARPMYGIRTPKEQIVGFEASGTIVAVGSAVTRFTVGDEVFGFGHGSLAQYMTIAEDAIALRPEHINSTHAAAAPISGLAALQAVRDTGGVRKGDHVLVIGASGAVGTFAVQIAKALGATVTGVASTRNLELVQQLGADHVIDYTREDLDARGRTYDVIIDMAGNRRLSELRSVLAPSGTLVIVGGSGGSVTMGFGRTIRAMALNPFVGQTLTSFFAKNSGDDLTVLAEMMANGQIVPAIDRTYPIERTVEALDHVGARHTSGKTVITV